MTVRNLLLVHPDHETKRRISKLLLDHDCEIIPARTTRQALGYIRVRSPHLVLTAEHLPDGDVENLIQSLRGSHEWNLVPILVLAADANETHLNALERAGATAVLPSHWDSDTMWEMIRTLTDVRVRQEEQNALGISGQLARFGIVELIQEMAKEHGSGLISIDGALPMKIYLRAGNIVHAQHGITIGKKALFRCLRIADAAYHFKGAVFDLEATIEGDLNQLIQEARASNQKLMANFHQMPQPQHRIKIVSWEQMDSIKFTAEARAALEVIKRYPLVRDYLDHLNLPDLVCFEYLITFKERGLIDIITQHRPTAIISDSSCDLGFGQLDQLNVQYVTLRLTNDGGEIADSPRYLPRLNELGKKGTFKISHLEGHGIADKNASLVPDKDCLNLLSAAIDPAYQSLCLKELEKMTKIGFNGQPLMANELVTWVSGQFSVGLAALIQFAAQAAASGDAIETIVEKLERFKKRLHVLYIFPATKGLLGGKATFEIQSWTGTEFKNLVKLGKGEELADQLIKIMTNRYSTSTPIQILIGHAGAEKQGQALLKKINQTFEQGKSQLLAMGPVSTNHLGLGTIGLAFYEEEN